LICPVAEKVIKSVMVAACEQAGIATALTRARARKVLNMKHLKCNLYENRPEDRLGEGFGACGAGEQGFFHRY
jgi:hypothetical protein